MERRAFLTLAVSFAVVVLYLRIFTPPPPPDSSGPSAQRAAPAEPGPPGAQPSAAESAPSEPVVAPLDDVGPLDVAPLENEWLLVSLTNKGAAVDQIWLKHHYRTVEDKIRGLEGPKHWVALYPEDRRGEGFLLREFLSAGERARWALDTTHWHVERTRLEDGTEIARFRVATRDGLEFRKTFSLGPRDHFVRVAIEVSARDEQTPGGLVKLLVRVAPGIQDVERGWFTTGPMGVGAIRLHRDVDVVRESADRLASEPLRLAPSDPATVAFLGASNLYFCVMALPERPGGIKQAVLEAPAGEEREDLVQAEAVVHVPVGRPGKPGEAAVLRGYAGPKDPRLLEAQGLDGVIPLVEEDYGSWESFRWINKLLLFVLRSFHSLTGNWGLAIILLTLVVRLCVFPITRAQQVSMQRYSQKMQELKPKLDELRRRYEDKPQKFAQEQMKLLREHQARPPVLGCLSMFITFPVFVAMFQILRTAIELRQAPFVAWIQDLSLPDRMFSIPALGIDFNLLPILATAAFVGQMILAPKPADPQARQQQKIMYFMPIAFGVMFYGYAAGLSLYMLTSSLWGMFEYHVIRKRWLDRDGTATAAVARPALERVRR